MFLQANVHVKSSRILYKCKHRCLHLQPTSLLTFNPVVLFMDFCLLVYHLFYAGSLEISINVSIIVYIFCLHRCLHLFLQFCLWIFVYLFTIFSMLVFVILSSTIVCKQIYLLHCFVFVLLSFLFIILMLSDVKAKHQYLHSSRFSSQY